MKKILKHGHVCTKYHFTCKRCGCEFIADEEDVKTKESFFPWGIDTIETSCPECYNYISGHQQKMEYLDAYTACIYVSADETGTYTTTSKCPDRTDDINNTKYFCED